MMAGGIVTAKSHAMIAQLENAARFTFRQVPRCFERAITLSVVLDALTCVKMVKAANECFSHWSSGQEASAASRSEVARKRTIHGRNPERTEQTKKVHCKTAPEHTNGWSRRQNNYKEGRNSVPENACEGAWRSQQGSRGDGSELCFGNAAQASLLAVGGWSVSL